MMLFFVDSPKILHVALWGIFSENDFFFEILISTIHYDCSFYMVLYYDTWCNWKLSHDVFIEFWKKLKIENLNI
jgi:hypothetical protein